MITHAHTHTRAHAKAQHIWHTHTHITDTHAETCAYEIDFLLDFETTHRPG